MLRKILVRLSASVAIVLCVLFSASFACQSQLDCLDLNSLTPRQWIIENSTTEESYLSEPPSYDADKYYIVKDAGLARWWGVPQAGETSPRIPAVKVLSREFGDGVRGYAHASKGSCILTLFKPRSSRSLPKRPARNYLLFSLEEDFTGEIFPGSSSLQLDAQSEEEQESLEEATTTVQILRIPIWILIIVFAAYPLKVYMLGGLRRYLRRERNQCPFCGYNLTHNESGVCSECGSSIR